MMKTPIAILGAGSWGTALAILLSRQQHTIHLWTRDAEHARMLHESRVNTPYLPEVVLPSSIHVSADLAETLAGIQDVLIAVPSLGFRNVLSLLQPFWTAHMHLLWATKGLDSETSQLLHEVVTEIYGTKQIMGVLSGPTFAKEVAYGLPTAVTIATNSDEYAKSLVQQFHCTNFRVYTTQDMIGVQIGGASKNVLAIAAGISDGLGFGANARSALITRGLAEMMRLAKAIGGQQDTLMGLSGMGDLVLTCTDNQSRNRRFGLMLGQGQTSEEAINQIGQVVEGADNVKQVRSLAEKFNVSMPIVEQVYQVLHEQLPPQVAVDKLLGRKPTVE